MSQSNHVSLITNQRKKEVVSYCKNFAVAFAGVTDNSSNSLKVWLINTNELAMGSDIHFGITGTPHISAGQPIAVKTAGGVLISKNSRLAEYIIRKEKESFEIPSPTGLKQLKLKDVTTYIPDKSNEKAYDLKGWDSLTEDTWTIPVVPREMVQIEPAKEETSLIDELLEDEISLQPSPPQERVELLDLSLIEIPGENFSNVAPPVHLNRYVSETAELKYQPILDPWQEEYKRKNFFNGVTTILDGGPGTGKTTTLIQRIKFLIDQAALQDYSKDLTAAEKEHISHASSNWVFYTPNELLKLYLKESMVREGLLANDQTVRVWQSERSAIMKLYGLISPGDKRSGSKFLHQRNSQQCFRYEQSRVNELLRVSEEVILKEIIRIVYAKVESLRQIAPDEETSNLVYRIRGFFDSKEHQSYQSLCNTLNVISLGRIGEELAGLRAKYRELVSRFVQINRSLINDEVFFELLFKQYLISTNQDYDIRIADSFRRDLSPSSDPSNKAKSFFRSILLSAINNRKEENVGFHQFLTDSDEKRKLIQQIDQLGRFLNRTRQFVNNSFNSLLHQWLPDAFLQFKKESLQREASFYMSGYKESQESFKIKHLHNEEQSLIIYILNTIVDIISENNFINKSQVEGSTIAYNSLEKRKTVIAIDEVTDLHPIDIAAIYSFKTSTVSSVTLCGDLAQRLTNTGIRRWEDVSGVIGRNEVKELQLSYRQGPKVLAIAEDIYMKATERNHEFVSYFETSNEEPDPLVKITSRFDEEVEWLVKRVLEIYKAHGNKIPSIAIFVPDESQVSSTAKAIRDFEELVELDINCVACNEGQALGDSNSLRVFSIDYIKGLEFEAVFFLNVDDVLRSRGRRIGLRLIYVGLSRAAFYLGITSSKPLTELNLSNGFKEVSNW